MKIKPLGKNIQIRLQEEKPKHGLELATDNHIITEVAKVIAIGEEVKKVKVGDRIMFKSWAIDVIKLEKKGYVFILEDLILAVL